MKRLLTALLALVLVCASLPALAETAEEGEGSKFEAVLLKKGSLIVKEFIDCGLFAEDNYYPYTNSLKYFSDTLKMQSASILDVETGVKVYALRVTGLYYHSDYDYGESVGVMDADEIDGAITTLQYIKDHQKELKDYSEIVYTTSSGMEIGSYHSATKDQIYIKVSSKATGFYPLSKIDELIQMLQKVQAAFGQ